MLNFKLQMLNVKCFDMSHVYCQMSKWQMLNVKNVKRSKLNVKC